MPRILEVTIPDILGVAEARKALSEIVKRVNDGEAFVIKGPASRDAVVMSLADFRELQESYRDLEGRLEARRMLDSEETGEALKAAVESEGSQKLSEVMEHSKEVYHSSA